MSYSIFYDICQGKFSKGLLKYIWDVGGYMGKKEAEKNKTLSKINKHEKESKKENNWERMIVCTDKLIKYLREGGGNKKEEQRGKNL